jgi:NADPH:quinone reductase
VIDAAVVGVAAHEALVGGGTFVSLVRPFAPPPIRGTRVVVHETFADGRSMKGLASLAGRGMLTPRLYTSFPLAHATRAHRMLEEESFIGRVVLKPR